MNFVPKSILRCSIAILLPFTYAAKGQTIVKVSLPEMLVQIDPMIYGQMLENVNDSMIYGGITDLNGRERIQVTNLLKPLNIPVMRWPGGTVIHEYHWKNGIGPVDKRPSMETFAWKGKENYKFGTDEFLQWCKKLGTAPYINFNMGNHPDSRGTLQEALDWIEYVNGETETEYGKLRSANGHQKPYGVKFWGVGNENYESWGKHIKESGSEYADRLLEWTSIIKKKYPDLKLMGVGHTYAWDKDVLEKCTETIDFLTQHYYVISKINNDQIQHAPSSLFAPLKMEAHIKMLSDLLENANKRAGRRNNPIRLSIDEWNNRHSVNTDGKYSFTRHDPRRQFDVAIAAGMLNTFIRMSPVVGMANYIFPVNAHGLIKTVGNNDAYLTALYPVFSKYRHWMVGAKLDVSVKGDAIQVAEIMPTIEGDLDEAKIIGDKVAYVDAVAILGNDDIITVALVNRNHKNTEKIIVDVPEDYVAKRKWAVEHQDINMGNSVEKRNEIIPREEVLKKGKSVLEVEISACGLQLIQFEKKISKS